MKTTRTKAPFEFATYCSIMQNTDTEILEEAFKEKADEIISALGEDVAKVLSSNIFTKNILVHAALNGTLKNSYIIFVVHKSLSYQKAAEVNKPSTFLYKIVPIWYRKELGDKYYTKRESILKKLGVPLETFLKLETYEEFRNIAPFLKKSALSHLSDSLKTLSIDFTKKDVESLLSDVA